MRRTLAYLDQNIARELAAESENQQWKLLKLEFLVARDNPKELAKTLEDWIKAGDADNRWRAQGYLLAEEGKLAEAIARFEAVAAADELGPGEWRTLAGWYQAMNRRADCDRAKIEIYKTAEEWQLGQWLYGQVQQWVYNQGQLPSHLDGEAVLAFRGAAGQIIQSAELHRRPAPRVVQGLPRFPPSFVPGRQHSRPHRRADLSLLAVGERRHRRNPRGGGRRFARRANCRLRQKATTEVDRLRLRPAGSDDRLLPAELRQPARPAR